MSGWDSLSWEAKRGAVLAQALFTCEMCGDAPAKHVDHIWPKSLGGGDDRENLRAACAPCNQAKGNRLHGADIDRYPYLADFGVRHAVVAAIRSLEQAITYSAYRELAGSRGCKGIHEAMDEDRDARIERLAFAVHAFVDGEVAALAPRRTTVPVDVFETCAYGCGAQIAADYANGPEGHYTKHRRNGDDLVDAEVQL